LEASLQPAGGIILVVDDDPSVRSLLRKQLELEGYRVELAADGAAALARLEIGGIDLVVLDRRLPDLDGLELCRRVRAGDGGAGLPIIMLTAAVDEAERLAGFTAGVDDYVTKPFSHNELAARIQAVLRRVHGATSIGAGLVTVDERLQIDLDEQDVIVAGERIRLRPTEYRLLHLLVENAGRTLPFETILARVWGPEYRDTVNYVHLYVTYLRQKIEPDPSKPQYILTKRGVGYSFLPVPRQGPSRPLATRTRGAGGAHSR
jgi:DNA-binding response OmpR family regulator